MGQGHSTSYPQVILMGLDSAGKSTILARLLTGQVMETSPTIGFNVGMLDLDKKTSLTLWDVGGQKHMRPKWRSSIWLLMMVLLLSLRLYLDDCEALVFVVDSSDQSRMAEAKAALKKILGEEKLQGVPLMVLANKKDLPNCMNIREVSNQLELPSYTDRHWEIQACSAVKGLGLQQAFISVSKMIKKPII
ncbi:ADP-ribosylation factor-like protein 11 isoform X1 [Archocentrus centrarchus]|uniref:ADP-ribosylation factor-like protein 11 isoform X1 n=1 Tax=Archocentrus centrarchus TaxID=63155 RepID=UPI0011EA1C56|nr:ADP-ribosylation factor-like protein 11 isoform X1 [Archocentrus centrarchus]